MAESPLERLKRLAKEKKDAAAKVVAAPEVSVVQPEVIKSEDAVNATEQSGIEAATCQASAEDGDSGTGTDSLPSTASTTVGQDTLAEVTPSNTADLEHSIIAGTSSSTHPLAMEFAELEQALLTKDPGFKTILRQVHRHLATDPDLVTQMTEAEIQSVVSGLVVMANADVVEPAKAKTLKAKVAAAKKVTIDVDDL